MILLKDSSFGSNISYICKDETRSTLETIMPYSLFNYAMLLFLETVLPCPLFRQFFLLSPLEQLCYATLLKNNYTILLSLDTMMPYSL